MLVPCMLLMVCVVQINAIHTQYYTALKILFDTHKVAAGYANGEMIFKY